MPLKRSRNSPGPEAFQPGLIVTVKLICAQMAMRWEEQAEEKEGASALISGV